MIMLLHLSRQHYFGTDYSGPEIYYSLLRRPRISLIRWRSCALYSSCRYASYGPIAGFGGYRRYLMDVVLEFCIIPIQFFCDFALSTFSSAQKISCSIFVRN